MNVRMRDYFDVLLQTENIFTPYRLRHRGFIAKSRSQFEAILFYRKETRNERAA